MLEIWKGSKGLSDVEMYTAAMGELDGVLGKNGRVEHGWTKEDMIKESGMSEKAFTETYLHHFLEGECHGSPRRKKTLRDSDPALVRASHFHLYNRTKHVLEESIRVSRFNDLCHELSDDKEPIVESDPRLAELGNLLIQSHESCQYLYDCTHPQTDALKKLCLEVGALGARQTGRSDAVF